MQVNPKDSPLQCDGEFFFFGYVADGIGEFLVQQGIPEGPVDAFDEDAAAYIGERKE